MKKILLITLIGTVFAATSAFACDTCAKHAPKGEAAKMECSADCDKPCCAKKAECTKECDKPCCAEKKACAADCDKPCCAEKKADTAVTSGAAPCCEALAGKSA